MKGKGQHLGIQQMLLLFMVGKNPGIRRTQLRNWFAKHNFATEGMDRRLRELDQKKLIERTRDNDGTSLTLSKMGQNEVEKYGKMVRESLPSPQLRIFDERSVFDGPSE